MGHPATTPPSANRGRKGRAPGNRAFIQYTRLHTYNQKPLPWHRNARTIVAL